MRGAFIVLGFLIVAVFATVNGNKLAEREANMESQIKKSITDPVKLGNFAVGPGEGVLRVNQTVNNMLVTGLAKAQLVKVKADFKEGTVFLAYKAKRLTAYVDYELNGNCLLIPIWGEGKGVIVMDDVRVTANATVENVDDKFQITSMKITYVISDGSFGLSSLYGESQPGTLTPLYVKAFNAQSKYIFNEILPLYIPQSEQKLTQVWQTLLKNV